MSSTGSDCNTMAIFQYIRLIRDAGALQWVWKESADLAAMCVTSSF